MGRRVVAALVSVGLLAGAAACSSTSDEAEQSTSPSTAPPVAGLTQTVLGPPDAEGPPRSGGELRFGLEAEPTSLDPSRGTFDVSAHTIASAIYDPLTTLDENGEAVPYLAQSIEPNEDFTVWTITLRPDVVFHDDTPLDADALAMNFNYWKQSFITAPSLASVETYEPTGPLEVTVTMSQPWTTFPYVLSTQTGYVAAPAYLDNPDPPAIAMQPIGTGPFRYQSYSTGTSFTADRFDGYWQDDLPYLDRITFRFVPDPQRRMTELLEGRIDMLHDYQPVSLTELIPLGEEGRLKIVENADLEEDVVAINTENAPFDDAEARRALAMATDPVAWRAVAEAGDPHEVRGPWAPGQLGYDTDDAYVGFDLEEAKRLAADYEARTGEPIRATYLTTGSVQDQALAQLLVEQWSEAGIVVTVESADLATLIFRVVSGEYDLASWRNFGAPDPDGEYLWWHTSGIEPPPRISTNVARFGNEVIDEALDEARGSDDEAVRQEAYAEVVRQLNEAVAYVWLGRPTWIIAAVPEVQGIAAAANGSGATLGAKTWLAELWLDR